MELDSLQKNRKRSGRGEAGGTEPSDAGAGAGMPAFLETAGPVLSTNGPQVQRQEKEDGAPAAPASLGLLVEDGTAQLLPGQMTKSQFLAQLHDAACATAQEAMAGTIWSVAGCPYIEQWTERYAGASASHLERAVLRYAPEAGGAKSAGAMIPVVCARLRAGIDQWRTTGEVEASPEAGAADGAEAPSGTPVNVNGATPALMPREGAGGGAAAGPAALQSRLGPGEPLEPGVRGRMESALGTGLGRVRVHTDMRGAAASDSVGARAFALGEHVAFGAGEYQPGTPEGDALIAHELAHVQQQGPGGATTQPGAISAGEPEPGSLEEDADFSAMRVIMQLWGGAMGTMAKWGRNTGPALRGGLRLQRCKSERTKTIEGLGQKQYDFMEQKRKDEEARQKKELDDAAAKAGLPPPTVAPKVEVGDVMEADTKKHAFAPKPTDAWTKLSAADKKKWEDDANKAWGAVVASVKGTDLEKNATGTNFKFLPETALLNGWYAWQTDHTLGVGMGWVTYALKDPKNVWENLAHEMGGHFEYGTTYAAEIMTAALELVPEAERKKWRGDAAANKKFFETYEYPETEVYSSLRQLKYREPEGGGKVESGGVHPYTNIPDNLNKIKDVLAPDVAKAVLIELKRRVDASPDILQRDKDYFVAQVKAVFGYSI
jgi:hypothetical protein